MQVNNDSSTMLLSPPKYVALHVLMRLWSNATWRSHVPADSMPKYTLPSTSTVVNRPLNRVLVGVVVCDDVKVVVAVDDAVVVVVSVVVGLVVWLLVSDVVGVDVAEVVPVDVNDVVCDDVKVVVPVEVDEVVGLVVADVVGDVVGVLKTHSWKVASRCELIASASTANAGDSAHSLFS